ncbi:MULTISPECIES: M56 family metallopeptidase [Nocardiopsis]|uniref:M48 family metalloprotease n=2 Tax=Nocardiopsis alba TaxID=53437 RepID=A0A7K2IRP1_9ACTN|nr:MULTISPECIES: M56 family metallopeptidase [Nocardiopsis]AFR10961.1 peptidase M48 family protein [Nocardiopsis alba ATCC BAA-2165]MEC3892572.1 M48 family metalloprotease [Nocardiopsis sp. LDBS1602]MYR32497.1 M48 family metalloprotease [Nocardiopsis alba]
MVSAALLSIVAVCCLVAMEALHRAKWPSRGPYTAVIAWQALGLAWGVSTIGALLAFGLSSYELGAAGGVMAMVSDLITGEFLLAEFSQGLVGISHLVAIVVAVTLTLVLFAGLVASFVQVVRVRRRHHDLLELVASDHPDVPGARVVDHPAAAAYCLPGVLRSQVVISAGALAVLDNRELAAVLAHEHAHLRQRHDLVLLPFSSLKRAFPKVRLVRTYYETVALLIEMCADDQARRKSSSRELAMALLRFGAAGPAPVPAGAMAAVQHAEPDVMRRVNRLLRPDDELPYHAGAIIMGSSAFLLAAVTCLWHIPV